MRELNICSLFGANAPRSHGTRTVFVYCCFWREALQQTAHERTQQPPTHPIPALCVPVAPPTHHGHPLRGLASFSCCAPYSSHVKAAIDVYTQALGMCPDHDDGLVARGAAFATTGRLRQAVQDLSQALSLNPHNDNASRYLKETRRCDRCAMLLSPRPVMSVYSNVSGTVRPTCEKIFRGGGEGRSPSP